MTVRRLWFAGRVALSALAVVLLVLAVARQWAQVRDQLDRLSVGWSLLALGFAVAGLAANSMTWKSLLDDLGSPLPTAAAARIFLLGQLGKYLPGSVWPVLAQMELGTRYAVPRRRSATTAGVTIVLGLTVGAVLAAGCLAVASRDVTSRYWPLLLAVPVGIALLWPPLLSGLVDRVLRLVRRDPLEHPLSLGGVARALAWSLLSWLLLGLQLWAITRDLGATRPALLLSIGAFAAAWTIGFLVIVAPAGVGVREGVLVLVMASALPAGRVLLLALVSRLVMTLGDLLCAVAVVAAGGRPGPARGRAPGKPAVRSR